MNKIRNIIIYGSFVIIACIIALSVIYQGRIPAINNIISITVCVNVICIIWAVFYYDVNPVRAGIILTFLHVIILSVFIFILKLVGVQSLPASGVLIFGITGYPIIKYKEKIINLLVRLTKKSDK